MTDEHSSRSRPAGWYPDPVDLAQFRAWNGTRWLNVQYGKDAGLVKDRALVQNLPRPSTFPAPEIAPRAPVRRRVYGGLLLLVLLIWAVSTSGGTDSIGGGSAEAACVDDVLTRDVVLVDAAIAYKPGRDGVDHGWSKAAVKLKMVPLDSCPSDFTSAFADYTVAVDKYGSFLEDRTGVSLIDDILDLDSDKKLRRLVDSINTSYASLEAAAMSLGVEAKRGSISLE